MIDKNMYIRNIILCVREKHKLMVVYIDFLKILSCDILKTCRIDKGVFAASKFHSWVMMDIKNGMTKVIYCVNLYVM